ncbi:MAG TPA: ester cyclase [Xanthobacteraceae bacterium]
MRTFGTMARYDDEPWELHYAGRDAVRGFYQGLLLAIPDLQIDVRHRHVGEAAVVLEVVIRGTHLGTWRGLPPTGARLAFPLCGVYTFDEADRLAGERIYYDRATVLRQLGLFREPEGALGRLTTALMHPLTMARIAGRTIFRSRAG